MTESNETNETNKTKKEEAPSLAAQMRKRLQERMEKKKDLDVKFHEYSEENQIQQVKSWIPLGEFFEEASGGQGFPCGHITQLIGKKDSGKTTLMMKGLVECQKQGGVAYMIEPEHKFDFKRFELMGGNPKELVYIEVDSLEDAWNFMVELAKDTAEMQEKEGDFPIMVGWDSIPATVPNKILEEDDSGNAHVAVEAKINNKNIRKLRQAIKKTNIACVFINHYYMSQPSTPYERPELIIKGGEEMGFLSTLIVLMKQGQKITRNVTGTNRDGKKKASKQQIGRWSKINVVKSHFNGKSSEVEVPIVESGVLEYEEDLEEYRKSLRGKA